MDFISSNMILDGQITPLGIEQIKMLDKILQYIFVKHS